MGYEEEKAKDKINFYGLLRNLKRELFTREDNEYPIEFIERLNIILS